MTAATAKVKHFPTSENPTSSREERIHMEDLGASIHDRMSLMNYWQNFSATTRMGRPIIALESKEGNLLFTEKIVMSRSP